jgi:hypothetical protein
VWGGCIGVAYTLKFIQENPDRVTAAVCQDPVGFSEGVNTRATFFAMFAPTVELATTQGMAAVVAAALDNPVFTANNVAGPFRGAHRRGRGVSRAGSGARPQRL